METVAREDLETRLRSLEEEFDKGQKMLRDVELQRVQLEQTLVRIEGAMTVLRELLEPSRNGAGTAADAEEP
jgi:predicted nuclease with TOPRIM domain